MPFDYLSLDQNLFHKPKTQCAWTLAQANNSRTSVSRATIDNQYDFAIVLGFFP
jgi:hypothetical protein